MRQRCAGKRPNHMEADMRGHRAQPALQQRLAQFLQLLFALVLGLSSHGIDSLLPLPQQRLLPSDLQLFLRQLDDLLLRGRFLEILLLHAVHELFCELPLQRRQLPELFPSSDHPGADLVVGLGCELLPSNSS
jgi:hypothetical protein